jgi:hypothetical protein
MTATTYRLEDLPIRIAAGIEIDPVTGCWLWTKADDGSKGYGRIWWQGTLRATHRVVYMLLVGPIPDDRPFLDHVKDRGCRHRNCCWPAHLEPVTNRENGIRGHSANAAKMRCPADHEYTPENTYVYPSGARGCRACGRDRRRGRR